ncbi:diadenylate cyclase CdaA [Furfurilactobacillus milii]|uniref:Diadenylate cyclase n=1 Tax=Furfurilactobacillus milii TaxID=2888272 RepID=A0ABT6DAS6_9LACO|nr:diadenylate cyclase CdaA [Furfurilactobacillus milii]QLE67030.1 YbbP [Furfurilactobacillus rossiae]MCF6161289.1 diadenylate cyclase CdaA [Furfurilactobacillus milii]MCF6163669.1 diadenylate cyclase CdaA [Furfurilactobacillus milii]MCF6418960.1 diadenylate cyclase CdaA [Furfurilactobacillus milii]MDF9914165.1 diadenylate cyclase CdaA [Furfurilactobacillus milii]
MLLNPSNWFTWTAAARLLDILVIWFVIYELIMLLRGTRAVTLFRGILVIIIIKIASWYLGLETVSWVMDQIINWGVIALVIIFQPEIRQGLERLGRGSFIQRGRTAHDDEEKLIDALDRAIQYMSKRRIGALISIQMETGLEEYIETGIDLDADVTGELLINIFIPNTPLHDGAVIIKDNRIASATAYLPLSDSNLIPKELGTRHRAAVGISEVTDALTIVVSEETGEVMFTRNNEMMRNLTQEDYLNYLRKQLIPAEPERHNWFLDIVNRIFRGGGHK